MVPPFLCSSLGVTPRCTGEACLRSPWEGKGEQGLSGGVPPACFGLRGQDPWPLGFAGPPIPEGGVSHSLVSPSAWPKPGCPVLSFHWLQMPKSLSFPASGPPIIPSPPSLMWGSLSAEPRAQHSGSPFCISLSEHIRLHCRVLWGSPKSVLFVES